MVLIILTDSD